jgi:hypothetical protein
LDNYGIRHRLPALVVPGHVRNRRLAQLLLYQLADDRPCR